MLLRKKIMLIIIGLSAALQSAVGSVVYAQSSEPTEQASEVSGKRAEMLRALHILYDLPDDETEDLTREVSRGEYAKILVKYFNQPYMHIKLTQKPYIDVELTNEYARDIKTVKDLNYVYDSHMTKYRPNDTVTLNEAAVMLMRGLGYTYLSDTQILSTISDLRLFKGIKKNISDGATLDDIYTMLENALNIGIVETEYKNGNVSYKSSKDKTVLSEYYDTRKMKGIVTASSVTGLSEAGEAVGKSKIAIDGKVYGLKYNNCVNYLGYDVDFYVTGEDEDVLYAVPNNSNQITEIASEDIESADSDKIYYSSNDTSKNIRLEQNFDVIYNKKAYSGYGMLKDILPKYGKITALDNNDDGKADVLFITSYAYYMVNDVYTDGNSSRVYTSDNKILDLSSEDSEVEIKNADGNTASFAAIKKYNVLTVAESRNTDGKRGISVIVSDKKVIGTLTGKDDDIVMIDETEYPAAKTLLDSVSLGYEGTYYIAHDGTAAFYKETGESSWNIGLIYKTYTDENDDSKFYISVYTPEDEFINYLAAENVNIQRTSQFPNGVRYRKKVKEALSKGEIIRYRLNDKNEIVKIEKADEAIENDGEKKYLNDSGLRDLGSASSSFYYRNGIFDGKIVTDSDTYFFVTPPQNKWDDKDAFYISASAILKSSVYEYSYAYKAYAYGSSDVAYANIVVIPEVEVGNININNESPLYTINEISKVMLNDDDIYNRLVMYGNGEKNIYYCSNDMLEQYDLKKLDIIQFEADSSKKILAVRKIMNADERSSVSAVLVPGTKNSNGTTPTKDVLYSGLICYGTVVRKSDKYIEYTYIGDTRYIGMMARCKYTKLEKGKSRNAVSVGSYNDVSVGDNFVAMISSGEVKDMVILK